MPVIGVADILVRPQFKDLQRTVGKELDGVSTSAGKSSGSKMGSALGGALKVGALAAGGAVIGGLGLALTKGFGRLQAIENAKAKLTGLGHTADAVTGIMKNATAAVSGTAFGLDEAATVAAGAVAAGVKPGKELERTLKLTGDAATIAGVGMSDMGAIFNKVASSNKIQGDVIAQLSDSGIPIVQLLGKELGKTSSEISDMSRKGEIDFATFQKAMEQGLGGAALEGGKTLQGAFKNTMAAVGRIGANLLSGVYPQIQKFFSNAIGWLKPLEEGAKVAGAAIGIFLERGISAAQAAFQILTTGDFNAKIRMALGGFEEDSALVGVLFDIREGFLQLKDVVGKAGTEIKGGVSALVAAFTEGGRDITSSGFAGILEGFGLAARIVWDAIQPLLTMTFTASSTGWDTIKEIFSTVADIAAALLPSLVSIGTSLGEASAKISAALWKVFLDVLNSVASILEKTLVPALDLVSQFMAKNEPLVLALVGGYIAFNAAQKAIEWGKDIAGLVASGIEWVKNAFFIGKATLAKIKDGIETGILIGLYVKDALIKAKNTAVTWAQVAATKAQTFAQKLLKVETYKAAAAWVAQKGAMMATSLATKAVTAAQWLMNAAMSANPIGLIIAAVVALVAGFVLAYNKIGWFKDGVNAALKFVGDLFGWLWKNAIKPAFDGIMVVVGAVVDWFQKSFLPGIQAVFKAVGDVFSWYYNTIVKPVFNAIFTIVNGFYLFFRGIFQLVVAVFTEIIAPAFMNFWHGVVEPVFNGIINAIKLWWDATVLAFTTVVNFVRDVLGAVFTWFRDSVITPVFNFVVGYINWWWTTVSGIFKAVDSFIRTVLNAVFTWFRDSVIVPVFSFISGYVSWWWGIVSGTFNAVVGFIRNTLSAAFTWFRDSVITPVFNSVKDTISNVWNNGIKPVFDLISKAIKTDVPNAFQTGVDAIKKAWDQIQQVAKAPVVFVIDKVINGGLIGAFNKVAGFLKIDTLPNVDSKSLGFARGGVLAGQSSWRNGDDQLVPMRRGEGVYVSEAMRDPYERARLHAMNKAAMRGQSLASVRAMFGEGFAKGGIFDPLKSMALTQGYNRVHKGIDLAASVGTPVYATESGRVSLSGPGASAPGVWGGNEIHIDGASGIQTWFAHLSSMAVKVGDMVRAGQQIALSGNTGITSGPHLHFGAFNPGWPNDVDPQSYLGGSIKGSGGGGGGFNPITALLGMAKEKLTSAFPAGGKMVDFAVGTGEKLIGSVGEWVTSKLGGLVDSAVTGVKTVANDVGMRAKWVPQITAALIRTGHKNPFSMPLNVESMFRRMMQESGGNPNAINNWDSNAAIGQASRGLMQVIPSTFAAFRDKGLSSDIFDPLANMVAAINYTQDRYGNLRKGWDQAGGYAKGGIVDGAHLNPLLYDQGGILRPGASHIINATGKPEAIYTNEQNRALQLLAARGAVHGGQGQRIQHFHMPEKVTVTEVFDEARLQDRMSSRGGSRA